MSNYTKVTMKKSVYEQLKIMAAAENRSITNYLENLVLTAAQSSTPANGKDAP